MDTKPDKTSPRRDKPHNKAWIVPFIALVVFGLVWAATQTGNKTPNDSGTATQGLSTPANTATANQATVIPTTATSTAVSTSSTPADITQQDQALCQQAGGDYSSQPLGYDGATSFCSLDVRNDSQVGTFNKTGLFEDPCADYHWATTVNGDPWSEDCGAPPETFAQAETDCSDLSYYPTPAQEAAAGGYDVTYTPFTDLNPPAFIWNPLLGVCAAHVSS